jgi:hypothetical protein
LFRNGEVEHFGQNKYKELIDGIRYSSIMGNIWDKPAKSFSLNTILKRTLHVKNTLKVFSEYNNH